MATLGQVMVEIGADVGGFERSMQQVERRMQTTGRQISRSADGMSETLRESLGDVGGSFNNINNNLNGMQNSTQRATQSMSVDLQRLPEHLRPFHDSIQRSQEELRDMAANGSQSLEQLQQSVIDTRVGLDQMTSVSSSGREGLRVIQEMQRETDLARMAVLGFNRDATLRLSTEQTETQLRSFRDNLNNSRQALERLRDAGDMGSYTAGMQQLQQQTRMVQQAMGAASQGGQAYMNVLRQMGIITAGVGNMTAIQMERMKTSFVNANNIMQARAGQSEKMIKNLARMDVRGLDQQFLNVGKRLEKMAKAGSVANVAIKEVGENASMKDIMDQVTLINMGLMRMQMVSVAAGAALLGMTAILANAAYGPSPSDVAAEQAEITNVYREELQKRKDEIYNFAGIFEDIEPAKVSGAKLKKNLAEQVESMKHWAKDLKILAKRGVDEGLIQELEKLGPAAQGEIHALSSMTDKELNEYVKLWQEKHKLAKEKSLTELEKLKQATDKKVKELQNSLMPLGVAFEDFKTTWAEAVAPFVESWGEVAAKVVEAATAVGDMVNKLNDLNPQITAAIGWIAFLATAFTFLLSPLAIGISRAGSFAVAFNAMWMVIGPLVIGLLSVAGTALLLAAGIVIVVGTMKNLWNNSEQLRKALTNLWNNLIGAASTAIMPLLTSLGNLKGSFGEMVQSFLGGEKTMSQVWQMLGDKIAGVITAVTPFIVSIFTNAVTIAVMIIVPLINFLVTAFQTISAWWEVNSPMVMALVAKLGEIIVSVFRVVASFIQSVMPTVMKIVTTAFQIIGDVANEVFPLILQVFNRVFPVIAAIIKFLMPVILAIIVSVWNNIKNVIVSALNIIINVFDFFKNAFSGNWKAAWENVKNILKNTLTFLWNLVQLIVVGKMLKGIIGAFKGIVAFTKSSWATFKKDIAQAIVKTKEVAVTTLKNMKTTIITIFKSIWNGSINMVTGFRAAWSTILAGIKKIAGTAFEGAKKAILKPIEAAKTKVLSIIRSIKDAFKNMKLTMPKIKLPKVGFSMQEVTKMGATFKMPKFNVSWNAKGGVFNGASILGGGQGVGEKGAEAVLPIQHKRYMKPFSNAVGKFLAEDMKGRNGGNSVSNFFEIAHMVVREEADIEKIAHALERKQRQQTRAKGGYAHA